MAAAMLPADRAAARCSPLYLGGKREAHVWHCSDRRGARSVTGRRAALLQEYVGYIQGVPPGQAGKLEPGEGETTQAIRHRLTAAAEPLGKDLEVLAEAPDCPWARPWPRLESALST